MGDDSSTWLPLGGDPGSTATRAVVFLMIVGIIVITGTWTWNAFKNRGHERLALRVLGKQEPAPWASRGWACGTCHTVNRPSRAVCERCGSLRSVAEMSFAAVPTEPDSIPVSVPAGAGAIVTLEHNTAAHTEGLNAHWRLRVNSVIVGSAAHRDGAVALLRAVEGGSAVFFDPNGSGMAAYPIAALIAAFESPKLPIREACPEKAR